MKILIPVIIYCSYFRLDVYLISMLNTVYYLRKGYIINILSKMCLNIVVVSNLGPITFFTQLSHPCKAISDLKKKYVSPKYL